MPRGKPNTDPLLAALIAKLPASGADWPSDQQVAWLRLMAMAFGAVYGGDAAARLGGQATAFSPIIQNSPVPIKPKKPPFYIDEAGFARNGAGERILPKDVTGDVVDLRGVESDLRTIVWKDGSAGVANGKSINIIT